MGLQTLPSASSMEKPLPSLPQPGSPTLTNPDMVLPDHFTDAISLSSPPKATRPPSPSYLVEQHRTWQNNNPNNNHNNNRSGLRPLKTVQSTTPHRSRESSVDSPVLRTSPARRAQYRYS